MLSAIFVSRNASAISSLRSLGFIFSVFMRRIYPAKWGDQEYNLRKDTEIMTSVYEEKDWPRFRWQDAVLNIYI